MVEILIAGRVCSRPFVQSDGMVSIPLRNMKVVVSEGTSIEGDSADLQDITSIPLGASIVVKGRLIAESVVLAEHVSVSFTGKADLAGVSSRFLAR